MEIFKNIDALHLKLGCNLHEFEGGASLPISYSDRLSEEIKLLLNGCGLFDLKSCWLIAISGEEAGTFLQGIVTSDVLKLEIGQFQSSLICNNKGKISYHLEILRCSKKEWIIVCDPGQGREVGTILDNFHVREDLELRLLNKFEMLRMDLIGQDSLKILQELGYSLGENFWKFEDASVITVQFNLGKIFRLINLVSISVLQNFVKQILTHNNSDLISLQSFDEIRISEGIPRFGIDYSNENFPQEAGLFDHISYEKGCYIGQEPHARMFHRGHPNWLSVRLTVPEKSKTVKNNRLFYDSKEVGKITSLGSVAKNGFFHGIGMIRNEFAKEEIFLAISDKSPPIVKQEPLSTIIKKK